MQEAERNEYAATMAAIFRVYDREPTKALMDLYWDAFRDLTLEQFSVGAVRAIRELKWLPKPAEIRELAGISGPRVLARQVADAWEAVCQAMRQHDYTTSVDFGPLVNAILRNMGGWQAACAWTVAELETWKRKEFEWLYEAFSAGDRSALRGEPLAGAFPGAPVLVAIGGVVPIPQLAAPPNPVSAVVRELADSKSLQDAPKPAQSPMPSPAADRAAERAARSEANDARAAEAVERLRARVAAEQQEAAE